MGMSQERVAEVFGVSRRRIQQIEQRVLGKLRAALGDEAKTWLDEREALGLVVQVRSDRRRRGRGKARRCA